jgi:hypothetical protein
VAELGRLIPEKWQWEVTEHENNSFIVPFPSRGDLFRSVAFEKAHIKEHNVDLLFEEWQPEEEGIPLPRVWIHIFRLPTKLHEFSVLWALGSMLGATQSVDMVTSLRKNYGRVEVTVLNVDLIPNMIDTVVIGDRHFSLPIQVEGREENEEEAAQMELDNGSNDKGNGVEESSGTRAPNNNGREGNDQGGGSGQQNPRASGSKTSDGTSRALLVGTVAGHGFAGTCADKASQQKSKAGGSGFCKGVGATNLSEARQQEVVQANEYVVDWQLISLQWPPVLKNSSVKSYHLEGKAHAGN